MEPGVPRVSAVNVRPIHSDGTDRETEAIVLSELRHADEFKAGQRSHVICATVSQNFIVAGISSFDYSVGAGDKCGWYANSEQLSCLQIQLHFVTSRLFHWKIGGLLPFEYLARESCTLPGNRNEIGSKAHQSPIRNCLHETVD